MKVISLVPSWTETLIESGINVIGRTRYCIHPQNQISDVSVVGGTKDWKWEKILNLKPDLLILDKEENPSFMGEQKEIPFHATHVTKIHDVPKALTEMSQVLKSNPLLDLAKEWTSVINKSKIPDLDLTQNFPGLVEWGLKPKVPIKKVVYVIWKDPWMAVSSDTFIGSILSYVGISGIETFQKKYPEISFENYPDKDSTLLLFSTEPYPFLKKKAELATLGFPYAIVNGESFSWFGIRSLRFLQNLK